MQTNKQASKRIITLLLALVMIFSNFIGVIEVFAATPPPPTINPVYYGVTTISGGGVYRGEFTGASRGKVYATLLNKEGKEKTSVMSDSLTEGINWLINLPDGIIVEEGDKVRYYQRHSKFTSTTLTQDAEQKKYKITYDANGGEGTMPEEKVNADEGIKYKILENQFTPPVETEFDKWMIGNESKNPGDEIEVNNDVVIKAIWKYIINPTASVVETSVNHPVNYQMYKDAIKDFPTALTVEHIKVITQPDITKVGGTQAEIEVRFSDGQFRKIPVTVNVKPDPKDKEIEKLNKNIEDLNKQITELNNTITEKDGEITELNKTITELETKLQECKNQCAIDKAKCEEEKQKLQDQIDTLVVEKTKLETVVKENRELIEELRAHIKTLEVHITDLKETIKGKDTEIAKLLEKIGGLETKIETLTKENTDLIEKLATANQKITDLEQQIEKLKAENTELKNRITELEGKLDNKTVEVKTLTDKIIELEKQVSEKTAQGEADAKEIEILKKELADIKKQLEEKNTEVIILTKEITTLKETIKTLEGEKTELTNNITRLETEVKELKETIKTSTEKIIELEKENAGLKAENKDLKDKVAEFGKQVEDAKTENTTLKTKIEELNNKITELSNTQCDTEELNRLKREKAALEAKLEGKDELIQELRNQIADLKKSLSEKDQEITDLKAKISELETKINNLTNENQTLREELDSANTKITDLEKALEDEKAKNQDLENQNKTLIEEKQILEDKNKQLEEEKGNLENKITDLEKEKEELKEKIKKLEETPCENPEDQTAKIKELEKQLAEKDKLIEELNKKIKDAEEYKKQTEEEIKKLNEKINTLETKSTDNDRYYPSYIYVDRYITNPRLERENRDLEEKVKKLTQENLYNQGKEKYVTVFQINSILYKTYVADELLTQGEMTDFKGFIKPFIVNDRTMIPLRYVSLSLGLEVDWNNETRTATFTNIQDRHNALKTGKITINADTLEMKDQNGKVIAVDSKPILREGRFYVSLTNLTRAFGGTNGTTTDGVKNTIEWDNKDKKVLVYKYVK